MDKKILTGKIEQFAPLETQEKWDCSGWIVNLPQQDVQKVLLCLTPTKNVLSKAIENHCDLIISHHPLFFVPFEFKKIQIYCAHTNLDKAFGGTTDCLIKALGFDENEARKISDFSRLINVKISLKELVSRVKKISENARLVNNSGKTQISSVGFCAGAGAEFIEQVSADAFITGDLKYHNVVDSDKILIDIGHFEGEKPVLNVLKCLLKGIEVIKANEKSPFSNI